MEPVLSAAPPAGLDEPLLAADGMDTPISLDEDCLDEELPLINKRFLTEPTPGNGRTNRFPAGAVPKLLSPVASQQASVPVSQGPTPSSTGPTKGKKDNVQGNWRGQRRLKKQLKAMLCGEEVDEEQGMGEMRSHHAEMRRSNSIMERLVHDEEPDMVFVFPCPVPRKPKDKTDRLSVLGRRLSNLLRKKRAPGEKAKKHLLNAHVGPFVEENSDEEAGPGGRTSTVSSSFWGSEASEKYPNEGTLGHGGPKRHLETGSSVVFQSFEIESACWHIHCAGDELTDYQIAGVQIIETFLQSLSSLRVTEAKAGVRRHAMLHDQQASDDDVDKDQDGVRCDITKFRCKTTDNIIMWVRLRRPLAVKIADMLDYPLQLSDEGISKELGVNLAQLRSMGCIPKEIAGSNAYVKFDQEDIDMFKTFKHEGCDTILRHVDKIRLLDLQIRGHLKLSRLKKLGALTDVFIPHSPDQRNLLRRVWGNLAVLFTRQGLCQPLDDVRDYFGEELGFYFLFVGCLQQAFLILFIIEVCLCGIFEWFGLKADLFKFVSAMIIILWLWIWKKVWLRTQSFYMNKWGADKNENFLQHRRRNNAIKLHPVISKLDGVTQDLAPHMRRKVLGGIVSFLVFFLFLCLVGLQIGANLWVYAQEVEGLEKGAGQSSIGLKVRNVLRAIQVKIVSLIWMYVSRWLVESVEQHDYLFKLEDAWAEKTFRMNCINAYGQFSFVAFVQPFWFPDACLTPGDCGQDLASLVWTVVLLYAVMGFIQVLIPWLQRHFGEWWYESPSTTERISSLEDQFLTPGHATEDITGDYLEMFLLLGIIGFFGMTRPVLLAGLAFVATSLQLRCDAWKVVSVKRRTFPQLATGIGVWDTFLREICVWSVFINVGLLFTQLEDPAGIIPGMKPLLERLRVVDLVWLGYAFVIVTMWLVLSLVLHWCSNCVSNEGPITVLQKQRHHLQKHRLFEADSNAFESDVRITVDTRTDQTASVNTLTPAELNRPPHLQKRPRQKSWIRTPRADDFAE